MSILFPKKLHLKFRPLKLLNRKNEAGNSIKNINEGSFIVQQKYLLGHFWDWWKDFQENLVLELKIFNGSYVLFSVPQNRKKSLRVENETILSHKYLVFNQKLWLLSSLKAALFAGQKSQMAMGISINSTLAEGSKCFRNHSSCGHPRVLKWKLFDFDSPFPHENMLYRQKWSASNPAHVEFFCWPFQCSTTFETNTFQNFIFAPVGKWILFLMLCNFSVFDGRYLFTIEHCHRASSASRVLECLLTKNGTRNFLKFSRYGFSFVVFRQQLSYASSSLPPNVTYVSSGTMHSLSILPLELWNFDNESKDNANNYHRWK